jgi:hypothetical protein
MCNNVFCSIGPKHAHHVVEILPLVPSMEQRAHGLGVLWSGQIQPKQTRGVSQCGLVIYIKKYLKAKEELWKLKYFTMQKYNPRKIL